MGRWGWDQWGGGDGGRGGEGEASGEMTTDALDLRHVGQKGVWVSQGCVGEGAAQGENITLLATCDTRDSEGVSDMNIARYGISLICVGGGVGMWGYGGVEVWGCGGVGEWRD